MYQGKFIFSQIMDFLPRNAFNQCVSRYSGNHRIRSFSCLDQFFCMAFAQLTQRESLRDIECCLRVMQKKLYHMGIRGRVSKSTLADANEIRDWRIYCDFAQILIQEARRLYTHDDFELELRETVYALDSSTIDLCHSLFPWARFRSSKAAIKLHTLLDLHGNIPTFIWITDGKVHDVNFLDQLIPEPGAIYLMDRAYLDFDRLYTFHQSLSFFVTRKKTNTSILRLYSTPVDTATGLKCDQVVALTGFYARKSYPERLRRVKFYDAESGNNLDFLTNNFLLPATTIADLYKCRWQVELFFKWIKQHLHIKAFYGSSPNAVKAQIWIAVAVYVLVAIIKIRLKIEQSLYTILQILSISLFEKMPIYQAFAGTAYTKQITTDDKQLYLFDF
ncbi:MAG: IS4 family transposase [Thermodesulfobacteriota bacterium]